MSTDTSTKNTVTQDYTQLVVFKLANELYAVDISSVNTIIRMQEITEVPRTPDFVEGVINLRGTIIPILDLRKKYCLAMAEMTKASRIVVLESNDQTVGMIVDAVTETLILESSSIEPPPPVTTTDAKHIEAVAKRGEDIVILLNATKILDDSEIRSACSSATFDEAA